MAAKKRATSKASSSRGRAPARRAPRKQKAESAGLDPQSCRLDEGDAAIAPIERIVAHEGGVVVGRYKEPLGGHPLVAAILPIAKIEPTPFQRDLSDTHHKRLAEVIQKTGRFLDPVIAVTAPKHAPSKANQGDGDGEPAFWTPNGRHRLEAMRRLGAKSITALIVPTREVAWQILALNTEKAHNLKERALEVIRIYRGLLEEDDTLAENGFAFYLEDPALVTLGVCYEKNGRFAGGAYHPVLRRVETFSEAPIAEAIHEHERLAALTLEVEENVAAAVAKLRAKGLVSPYLRSFVVARINPLRWIQGELPPAEKVLVTMRDRAAKFNADKVKQDDLARMGGGVPDDEP
ncbi:MAG: chromosome partitioning protein ParB [Labilithrix sp.]|nr:chromosome partitioning protein ParB [Labilithrix sp.]